MTAPCGCGTLRTGGACRVLDITGQEPEVHPSSTDANIPLSLGIPANTIGAVSGALLHTRDEWIDARSLETGLEVILASMLSALR